MNFFKKATKAIIDKEYKKIGEDEIMIDLKLVREFKDPQYYFGDRSLGGRFLFRINDNLTVAHSTKERVMVSEGSFNQTDVKNGIVEEICHDYPYDPVFMYPVEAKKGDYVKKQVRIFFEDLELTNLVSGKLGEDDNLNPYTPKDFEWVAIKTGFIGFRSERIYYVKMKIKKTVEDNLMHIESTFDKVIQVNFVLGNFEFVIRRINECSKEETIIIQLSKNQGETLLVVWDLNKNTELKNYTIDGTYQFLRGRSSEYGYILSKDYYVNLENNIENYFFDRNFDSCYFNENS